MTAFSLIRAAWICNRARDIEHVDRNPGIWQIIALPNRSHQAAVAQAAVQQVCICCGSSCYLVCTHLPVGLSGTLKTQNAVQNSCKVLQTTACPESK